MDQRQQQHRIAQLNCNHDAKCNALLQAFASKSSTDFLLLADPYIKRSTNKIPFSGYTQIRKGRTAILIRHGIRYDEIPVAHEDAVAIKSNGYLFISIYSPPSGDLQGCLEACCITITANNSPAIIGGDLNCTTSKINGQVTNTRGAHLDKLIDEYALILLNNSEPTRTIKRLNATISSILDYTLCSQCIPHSWQVHQEDLFSDHRLITYELGAGTGVQQQPTRYKINHEALIDVFRNCMPPDLQENPTNEEIDIHCNQLAEYLYNCTMKASTALHRDPIISWWTPELEQLQRSYNKAAVYARKTNLSPLDAAIAETMRKAIRKIYRSAIDEEKERAWRFFCSNEKLWGRTYNVMVKKTSKQDMPQAIYDRRADLLAEKFPDDPLSDPLSDLEEDMEEDLPNDSTNNIPEISSASIAVTLKTMSNRSAPGPDKVGYKTIKAFHRTHPEHLAKIFNICMASGHFPAPWKEGRVTFIPKPGKDPNSFSGYRPITLLPTIGKIFERCIKDQLDEHLSKHAPLHKKQFGFRKKKSTEDAIHALLAEIKDPPPDTEMIAIISLDIKGAFDHARWSQIIRALRKRKVPTYLIRIIKAYFSDRWIDFEALRKKITRGCPQGSVLGPPLWNILFDDILSLFSTQGYHWILAQCFADDTALTIFAESIHQLRYDVEMATRAVKDFLDSRGLELSVEKTQCLVVDMRNDDDGDHPQLTHLKIVDKEIPTTETIKYLGVIINNRLDWENHIEYAIGRSERYVPLLSTVCRNLYGYSTWARRIMYHGTVMATLQYCSSLFYLEVARKDHIQKALQHLRRRMSNNIARLYRTVGVEAAGVIAGVPPIDLSIAARAILWLKKRGYPVIDHLNFPPQRWPSNGKASKIINNYDATIIKIWQQRWDTHRYGRWTHRLLPSVQHDIPPAEIDFYLGQALTSHGCFRHYLHKRRLCETAACDCGHPDETAQHVLYECRRQEDSRPRELTAPETTDLKQQETRKYLRNTVHRLWQAEQVAQHAGNRRHPKLAPRCRL